MAVPITANDFRMLATRRGANKVAFRPLGCEIRTWRGVNHQRLPVDAIVDIVMLMSCSWWYCNVCWFTERQTGEEGKEITTMMARMPYFVPAYDGTMLLGVRSSRPDCGADVALRQVQRA